MRRQLGVTLIGGVRRSPKGKRVSTVNHDRKLQLSRGFEQTVELRLIDAQQLTGGAANPETKSFGDLQTSGPERSRLPERGYQPRTVVWAQGFNPRRGSVNRDSFSCRV